MRLTVLFEPSDEGGYTAHVPALPGCISEGDTLEEARRNIREAIEVYLEPDEEPAVAEGGHVEETTAYPAVDAAGLRLIVIRRRAQ